jgi:hypothetical protein
MKAIVIWYPAVCMQVVAKCTKGLSQYTRNSNRNLTQEPSEYEGDIRKRYVNQETNSPCPDRDHRADKCSGRYMDQSRTHDFHITAQTRYKIIYICSGESRSRRKGKVDASIIHGLLLSTASSSSDVLCL